MRWVLSSASSPREDSSRSAFVPMNVPLCAFMLMASSTPQILAAQWPVPHHPVWKPVACDARCHVQQCRAGSRLNQTYNALNNYVNRSGATAPCLVNREKHVLSRTDWALLSYADEVCRLIDWTRQILTVYLLQGQCPYFRTYKTLLALVLLRVSQVEWSSLLQSYGLAVTASCSIALGARLRGSSGKVR